LKKKKEVPTVDVLSHKLVPEMKILSESEKTKLLQKFSISQSQLPRMFAGDQAAVALKAVPGNIIRIERDDGTGKYTTYRVVVD
jgi:DNA-directed RNA polymerase I, II, and III subunit RPABC1